MKKDLVAFEQKEILEQMVTMYGDINEPLFLASDVAKWIGYNKNKNGQYNVSQMLETIDEDEIVKVWGTTSSMSKTHTPVESTGIATRLFLTEDGLYETLMQSRLPNAKEFKKKIKNILRQTRMTGGYIPISESDDELMILTRAMQIMQKTVARKDDIIAMQQPKVQAYESLMDSRGNVDFAEFVKSANLSIGRNTFMSILRDKEILRQNNEPYQHFMKYFEVIQTVKGTHSFSKTLINKLGMDWLIKKCVEWEITN